MFLSGGFKPAGLVISQLSVFGCPALYTGAPFLPVAPVHLMFHETDHFRFVEAELGLDRLEGSPVFPGHFHDPVEASFIKFVLFQYFSDLHITP